jgi:hypothetical protein
MIEKKSSGFSPCGISLRTKAMALPFSAASSAVPKHCAKNGPALAAEGRIWNENPSPRA